MAVRLDSPSRSVLQTALSDLAEIPASSRWVRSGDVNLHVLDYGGDLCPVVLLPGITSPAITMDFVARELVGVARPVVMDMRGRGLSDSADSYGLQAYVDDAAAVIDALDLAAPILVGHSMGARVAALAAAQGAGHVSASILVDPPMSSGPGRGPYPVSRATVLDQLNAAARGTSTDEMARVWPNWPRREQGLRARWLSSCATAAVIETHDGFEQDDFFDFWPDVPAPTVLMYGAESVMVTRNNVEEAREANPAARFLEIPCAGHMVFWDSPDASIAALHGMVAEFTASTATRK